MFCDDSIQSDIVMNLPVVCYDPAIDVDLKMVIGIGNNEIRKRISGTIKHAFTTIIHPSAVIANDVIVEEGAIILANAVVQAGTRIGKHVIINAGVCVDHDVVVEDFVHIYPNAYIGGGAVIKALTTVEACQVIPRRTTFDKGIFI